MIQANLGHLALATLLEEANPDAQVQQDENKLAGQNGIKVLLSNSTENASQTGILQENAGTYSDFKKQLNEKSGGGQSLPCPPVCIPKIPTCPPLCDQGDMSEKVSNPFGDVVTYREGAAVGGNETGPSDKVASSGCFGAELLVGGGWKSKNPDVIVQSSYAEKNQWFVQYHVPHGAVDLKAFALCLKFNPR